MPSFPKFVSGLSHFWASFGGTRFRSSHILRRSRLRTLESKNTWQFVAPSASLVQMSSDSRQETAALRIPNENDGDDRQHRHQHGRAPGDIAEEARHLDAALDRDGVDHEIGRIADV